MSAVSLMYHDILAENAAPDESGFTGGGPAVYKISVCQFKAHLAQIAKSSVKCVLIAQDKLGISSLFLTFDDGGRGALVAAEALEQYGLRGHFFVTTDYIGHKGFLTEDHIRQLHQRGHVLGSHSCSHPERMDILSDDEIKREWLESTGALSQILNAPVLTGSVPAGYYSKRVALAAEKAGIRFLFTSEPVKRISMVGNCIILGRYTINRFTTLSEVTGLIAEISFPAWKQYALWNSKKIMKQLGGKFYLKLRKKLLK